MRLSSAERVTTRSSVSGSRRNSAVVPSNASAASLHLFVYEQKMFAFACGKERRAKGETVDFAPDLEAAAAAPNFLDVERNPDNDPTKIGSQAFESGFERLFDKPCDWLGLRFGFRFHCGATENEGILVWLVKSSELLLRLRLDGQARAFFQDVEFIDSEIVEFFQEAAGPADLHRIEFGCRSRDRSGRACRCSNRSWSRCGLRRRKCGSRLSW